MAAVVLVRVDVMGLRRLRLIRRGRVVRDLGVLDELDGCSYKIGHE